ncbi:Hypothetical_protein [Hexamita inflata]|uniref:Hypothetical_protein n=1 Tax=Hexamita inflata TaxID=28002 RepID=A0ABP1GU43_9EUKA
MKSATLALKARVQAEEKRTVRMVSQIVRLDHIAEFLLFDAVADLSVFEKQVVAVLALADSDRLKEHGRAQNLHEILHVWSGFISTTRYALVCRQPCNFENNDLRISDSVLICYKKFAKWLDGKIILNCKSNQSLIINQSPVTARYATLHTLLCNKN